MEQKSTPPLSKGCGMVCERPMRLLPILAIWVCVVSLALQTEASISATEKQEFLKEHNAYRAEVGAPALVWDDDLESIAQEWADELVTRGDCAMSLFLQHRSYDDANWHTTHALSGSFGGNPIGENLYTAASSVAGDPESKTGVEVTNGWTSEKADWNFGSCCSGCTHDGVVGHYTQVVWHDTQRIGCGKTFCTDPSGPWYIGGWVCNYYPAGNFNNKYPYCPAANPAHVGTCAEYSAADDASKQPSDCTGVVSTASCPEDGASQCSTDDPCSLTLTWPEIDAAEDSGTLVFTGGLGELMDADHESWLCWEDSGCAANDLACFKYNENDKVFEWYGFNSALKIVAESEYLS